MPTPIIFSVPTQQCSTTLQFLHLPLHGLPPTERYDPIPGTQSCPFLPFISFTDTQSFAQPRNALSLYLYIHIHQNPLLRARSTPLPLLLPLPQTPHHSPFSSLFHKLHLTPQTQPDYASRIIKLTSTLTGLKPTFDIRQYYLSPASTQGHYCAACTRHSPKGTCGPTCPLLRPANSSGTLGWITRDWAVAAEKANKRYQALVRDVAERGHKACRNTIVKWEEEVEEMRREALGNSERLAEDGWPGVKERVVEGLRLDWDFEGRWGKGPGLEEEVEPEEVR